MADKKSVKASINLSSWNVSKIVFGEYLFELL